MKILPLVKGLQNDIASTSIRLKEATADGYRIADRTSKVYRQGYFRKCMNVTRMVTNKVVKGTTLQEMPYVVGAIGTVMPIPLSGPIMLGLGFLARISVPKAISMFDKIRNSQYFKSKEII